MSTLQKYGVSLEFTKAMKGLKAFMKTTQSFNKAQEKALDNQIAKQKILNKLRGFQPPPIKPRNIPPTSTSKPLDTDTKSVAKVNAALRKRTDKEIEEQQRLEVSRAKARINSTKAEQDLISSRETARRKQAVNSITAPSGAENMRDFYKQQAKEADKLAAVEARRVKSLQKARDVIQSSAIMQKKVTTSTEKKLQENIKIALSEEKSASALRNQVRKLKGATAELKKQNFLMKRMKSSSEQFAGNMVSAFAIAAGGAAVTRVGQDFEAVSNTMLAVSENSEMAGSNLQFVKEEAFRLGLGLKESAKGFAKMLAARGKLSLEDTKESFKGVAEMSTLLGLSAEESNRAVNALQQIGGLAS